MKKIAAFSIVVLFLTLTCISGYNPVYADSTAMEDTWTKLEPMNTARSYFGAVALNGKIYAIGGSNEVATGGNVILPATDFTGGVIGTNEVYDPAADSWVSAKSMITARMGFGIAAYGGKIYCFGGNTHSWYYGWDWRGVTGVTEIYDPATNTWQTGAAMPNPLMDFQANVINGKIYCIGGIDKNGEGSKLNQVYDPATNTWSQSASLPTSTFKYASAVLGGKIYVINGVDWYSMQRLQLTQVYNPENDTWSYGAASPYADNSVGATTLGVMSPPRIYTIGNFTQIYDPFNDTWSLGREITPSRWGLAALTINDKLYVMGGTIIKSNMNSVTATETQFNLLQQYLPVGHGTIRPNLSILSPTNQTLNQSSVALVFNVDRALSWAGYSLDNQGNITFSGNQTIEGLKNGPHTITIYANDTYGNFIIKTVDFRVTLAPFPTLEVTIVLGAAAAIALLFYFKKYKKPTNRLITA